MRATWSHVEAGSVGLVKDEGTKKYLFLPLNSHFFLTLQLLYTAGQFQLSDFHHSNCVICFSVPLYNTFRTCRLAARTSKRYLKDTHHI